MFPSTPPSLSRKSILKLVPEEVTGSLSPAQPSKIDGAVNTTNNGHDNIYPLEKLAVPSVRFEEGSNSSATEETATTVSSPIILTTGLLSLCIHEELTFNGTEIALHPDLFAHSILQQQQQQQSHSNTTRQHHHHHHHHHSTTIMPGDLLEVRVWDHVTDFSSAKYANSKVLRPSISNTASYSSSQSHKQQVPTTNVTSTNFTAADNGMDPSTTAASVSPPQPILLGQSGGEPQHHEDASFRERSSKTIATAASAIAAADAAHNTTGEPPQYMYRSITDLPYGNSILVEFPSSVSSSSPSASSSSLLTTATNAGSINTSSTAHHHHHEGGFSNSFHTNKDSRVYKLRTSFVIKVGKHFALKENSRTQISLLRQVAELYHLSAYDTVTVTKIDKHHHEEVLKHVSTDFMMVTIKDQFISRGEMFHYLNSLIGKWVFCGERLTSQDGVRAIAKEIRHADKIIKSGIITKETKITFRSRSARIIWVVQISTEMWDYASPYESNTESKCQIYFNKFVQFMYRLFEKWRKLEVTHSLTVLFFSRTYVLVRKESKPNPGPSSSFPDMSTVQTDSDGRLYQDHYKVVVENETRTDWESLVLKIKKAFLEYPRDVGWSISSKSESRIPSTAAQGNLLEAINVTLNVLSLHYIDRDLHRTGNSIVVVSAGNGVFEVEKKIAGITKQRMMDNGIGSDMLCLGLPPLHVAPFFLYKEVAATNTNTEETWFDSLKTYFEIPHWMNLSFVEYDPDKNSPLVQTASDTADATAPTNLIGPNGFAYLVNSSANVQTHSSRPSHRHALSVSQGNLSEMSEQRSLISCRDFEDIVEACRPRYRTYDSIEGLPSALRALLHKTSLMHSAVLVGAKRDEALDMHKREGINAFKRLEEKSPLAEWGAVDFDAIKGRSSKFLLAYSNAGESYPLASDEATVDFTGSNEGKNWNESLFHLHMPRIPQQKSFALPFSGESNLICDEVIERSQSKSIAKLKLMMENYDASVLSFIAKKSINSIQRSSIESAPQKPTTSPDRSQRHGIGAALKGFPTTIPPGKYQSSILPKVWSAKNIQAVGRYSQFSGPSSLSRSQAGNIKYSVKRMPVAVEPPDELDLRDEHIPDSEISKSLADKEFLSALGASRSSHIVAERIGPFFGSPSSLLSLSGHGMKKQAPFRQRSSRELIRRFSSQESDKTHSIAAYNKLDGLRHPNRGRSRRKPWVLNPFRQQDEDEMLSKRTHNRRRWSHVFPPGEAEFKRHSGPLWNSLCQPAVLPLSTDYLPEEYELNDPEKFEFNHYNIFIDAMDRSYYNSYSELLSEMVIQRIIQDYQIVSQDVLDERLQSSEFKKKSDAKRSGPPLKSFNLRSALLAQSNESAVQHILSMGHNVVYLRYNKHADVIEVVQYHAKFAQNDDSSNTYTYRYLLWMPLSADFQPVSLIFKKFGSFYRWNRLDNLICGDPSKVGLSEDFRFRRIGFGIIPDRFDDSGKEQKEHEYVQKFLRLLDYLKKLVPQKDAPEMDVKIVSSSNRQEDVLVSKYVKSADRVKRFIIQLRKGTRDKYEWLELVLDATFDTQQAFRIDINWLVASGSKVEAQIQLLLRRCLQYGLRIVQLPNYANSSYLYLHPFIAPSVLAYESSYRGRVLEEQFSVKFQFVNDGKRYVDPVEIPAAPGFQFPILRGKRSRVVGRQYVHRSGIAFIRAFEDEKGYTIFLWLQNRFLTGHNEEMIAAASSLLNDLKAHIAATCIS